MAHLHDRGAGRTVDNFACDRWHHPAMPDRGMCCTGRQFARRDREPARRDRRPRRRRFHCRDDLPRRDEIHGRMYHVDRGPVSPSWTGTGLGQLKREAFVASSRMVPHADVDTARIETLLAGKPGLTFIFDSLGGAVRRISPDATAFPHRQAVACIQIYHGVGADPAVAHERVSQARDGLGDICGPAAYVNYIDPGMPDWATAYYGDNLPRLRESPLPTIRKGFSGLRRRFGRNCVRSQRSKSGAGESVLERLPSYLVLKSLDRPTMRPTLPARRVCRPMLAAAPMWCCAPGQASSHR